MSSIATQPQPTPGPPGPRDQIAVHCRGITKTYGKGENAVQALRHIDIDVKAGELLMLVGPSGCGKTTLISVIAGVLERDEGECTVFGIDYKDLNPSQRANFRALNIGFVFQAFNLIPTLTLAENVAVPLLIQNKPRHASITAAKAMLDRVGLGNRVNDFPQRLSGGQQQRVAISRALVHHPRLIVCDEPTSALDAQTGDKIMTMLRQVALEEGRSLIVVTHDSRIFKHADRIARLNDGHVEQIVTDPHQLSHD